MASSPLVAPATMGENAPSPILPVPAASEIDTTMEEEDDDAQDDEFAFNAPTYYDLKRPEMERQYVNNADGYFIQPETAGVATPPRPVNPAGMTTPQRLPAASPPQQHTPFGQQPPANQAHTPFHSPQVSRIHTPIASIQPPVDTVVDNQDVDEEMGEDGDAAQPPQQPEEDDRMSDGAESNATLVLDTSMSSSAPPAPSSFSSTSSAPRSHNSSLFQPTKAYLQRVQAAQAARSADATAEEGASHKSGVRSKPQLTRPRSPQFHTSHRVHNNEPKLSSTSRELQQIKEDKLRAQQEAAKAREYHERVRAQRLPATVHQRSTKQLTIPQSPHLEVDQRSRRFNHSIQSEDGSEASSSTETRGYIPPEQLLSREFEFPATHSRAHSEATVPHTPQLRTSERAARRNVFGDESEQEAPARPDFSKMKVNGLTKPVTPQLETDRRAQQAASYRKPMEVVDKDAEELKHKFHARPVPKKILEPQARSSPQKAAAKAVLTKPVSPKLATSARARMNSAEEEQQEQPPAASLGSRLRTGPTIPETPPLRSLQRHKIYQENLRRQQEAEEEELRRQREFKAQPMRVTSTPPKFEGSKRPLTEVMPFALRSDQIHERAQERMERLRREEEEQLRAAAQFKATPMPDMTPDELPDTHATRVRQLTKAQSPKLALNRRASERAVYEAAERERRAREEEQKRQQDEQRRRQEEEEIKRLRRDQLTFHARPVPAPKVFELKPNKRPLTEPESPLLHTKMRSTAHGPTSAA